MGDPDPALTGRLTDELPDRGEDFHPLAELPGARVEHIVSSDTPDTGVQLQEWDEWVLVLAGAAVVEVAGNPVRLVDRSWLLIPAGTPHRVVSTRAGTHWVAVHGTSPTGR